VKLYHALSSTNPSVVTIEVSPFALELRRQRGPALRARLKRHGERLARELGRPSAEVHNHPAIALLRAALYLPFEHVAAKRWARAHGARCLAIDDSERSRGLLALLEEEALDYANLRALLEEPDSASLGERVIEQELLARQYLRRPGMFAYHFSEADRTELADRDRLMAVRIRALLEEDPEARLAHVCGWEHLVLCDAIENIAAQLAELEPSCALIV
jgi:hypothetical protein